MNDNELNDKDEKHPDYCYSQEERLGIKYSTWSADFINFDDFWKYPKAKILKYDGGWGKPIAQDIDTGLGLTWGDIWTLCDKMIRASGDSHHIFIECFEYDEKTKTVTFFCGS